MVPVYDFACISCVHRKRNENGIYCGAYPNGIPRHILECEVDPRETNECGNGYKFEDKRIKDKTAHELGGLQQNERDFNRRGEIWH